MSITNRAGFRAEFDKVGKDEWYALMETFSDATIIQSWDWGHVWWKGRGLSHMVLRRHGEPVAAAQVNVRRVPGLGGMALAMWGPMWKRPGHAPDPEIFSAALAAMHEEYVGRRRLMLRVIPNEAEGDHEAFDSAFRETGLERASSYIPYRTYVVDLSLNEADMRAGLRGNWRGHLKKAESNGLEIVDGSSPELLKEVCALYTEMHQRKGFTEAFDHRLFAQVQTILPDRHKLRIFVARKDGVPVAGIAVSLFGNTAHYLLGATGNAGTQLRASYLLQWNAIRWAKASGATLYDLHGVDPERDPGVHHFKQGLAGKNTPMTVYMGVYQTQGPLASRVMVQAGEAARRVIQETRRRLAPREPAEQQTA